MLRVGDVEEAQEALRHRRVLLLADLLLHDLLLGRNHGGAEHEVPHALGLELHREVEVVRRHRIDEVRRVLVGGRVDVPADAIEHLRVGLGAHVLGALEHHVLEHVGRPSAVARLVLAAGVVPDLDGDDRGAVDRRTETFRPFPSWNVSTVGRCAIALDGRSLGAELSARPEPWAPAGAWARPGLSGRRRRRECGKHCRRHW